MRKWIAALGLLLAFCTAMAPTASYAQGKMGKGKMASGKMGKGKKKLPPRDAKGRFVSTKGKGKGKMAGKGKMGKGKMGKGKM